MHGKKVKKCRFRSAQVFSVCGQLTAILVSSSRGLTRRKKKITSIKAKISIYLVIALFIFPPPLTGVKNRISLTIKPQKVSAGTAINVKNCVIK